MNKLFILALIASVACVAFANDEDAHAVILNLESHIDDQGHYSFNYETSNHINVAEKGIGGETATGEFSYKSPEGEDIRTTYVADENGFQPSGSHIPQIPEHVYKTLEYIRTHPQYDEHHH